MVRHRLVDLKVYVSSGRNYSKINQGQQFKAKFRLNQSNFYEDLVSCENSGVAVRIGR